VLSSGAVSLAFPHLVFLVNPEAREGRATRRLRGILARAPAWAASSRLVVVASLAGAERAIRAMSPEEIPIAAGGDGTVNFVARAVRSVGRAGLPMAILPLGTGNAVAHALGVGDLRRALAALAEGHSVALDALVTDHPGAPLALSSLSAGFEGAVLSGLSGGRGVARAAGLLGELPGALLRRGGIGLEVEGRPLLDPGERAFCAGIYNLPCYAFGRLVLPDADGTDAAAEAVVHRTGRSWLAALRGGLSTRVPLGGEGPVRTARAVSARLSSRGPIQVDGEGSIPRGDLEVRVEPAAIRIIAARPAKPAGA
jgi:diacylglycerol kinase (ATP)